MIVTRTAVEIGVGGGSNLRELHAKLSGAARPIYAADIRRHCAAHGSLDGLSVHHVRPRRRMPQHGSRAEERVIGNASRTNKRQSQTLLSLEGLLSSAEHQGLLRVGSRWAIARSGFVQRSGTPESASMLAW